MLEQRSATYLPYPLQGQLVGALREEALRRGRLDLVTLWSGQSAHLLRHRHAAELFQDLLETTEGIVGSHSGAM
jgi:nitronate monooxygenase